MSRMIRRYTLDAGSHQQTIKMPRRARVLYAAMESVDGAVFKPCLLVEQNEDADTKAFDTGQHQRTFLVLTAGSVIPEDAGYIGSCTLATVKSGTPRAQSLHIFEVRG